MRRNRENQLPLSGLWPDHRLAQELKAVSKILDDNPSILELVLHDLCDTASSGQGAPGLSAEQVLRAAILKNWHQFSYSVGVPLERLPEFSSLRPPALPMDSQCLLPAGEHQPHPSLHLAADQPAPGAMGGPPGTGTGTQDSSRCHGRGKSHPPSAGFPVVVRRDSSPHPAASPVDILTSTERVGSTSPRSRAASRSTAATPRASPMPTFTTASWRVMPAVSRAQRRISGFTAGIASILE